MDEKHIQMDLGELVKIPGGRGGKRPGAGRKGNGWEVRRVALSLPPTMWAAIDKEKIGSTAEAIRNLLERALPPEIKLTPLGDIPPINLRAAFYGKTAEEILTWIGEVVPVTAFDFQTHGVSWDTSINFVAEHYASEEMKSLIHERLLSDFPDKCGIGPSKVEEILSCTKTERKRWEQQGYLNIVTHFNAGKRSKPVWVPMYDRRLIESLTSDVIAQWRTDHEVQKAMNRREKEKKTEVLSRYVLIEAYQEGSKPYRIFGPVRTDSHSIGELWEKHNQRIPFEWEEETGLSWVVQLKDFHTDEVLKMSIHSF